MNLFLAFVLHAHDQARQILPRLRRSGRWAIIPAIVVGLIATILGPLSPAWADSPPVPAARLQVIVKKIHINNDRSDYEITYEIVRTPLPDLHVRGFRIVQGTPRFWCAQVENVGQRPSRLVSMNVRVDGTLLRQPILPALEVRGMTEHCVAGTELSAKDHVLEFSIDEPDQVSEMDETNNVSRLGVQLTATAGASSVTGSPEPTDPTTDPQPPTKPARPEPEATVSPSPKPTGKTQADLSVRAIHVDGQTPDGKNGCKADVTVVIKNGGTDPTPSFITRLLVDGKSTDVNVDGLDAGQERDVAFNGVRLTSGEHTLKGIVDADGALAEHAEDNNALKISAHCKTGGT